MKKQKKPYRDKEKNYKNGEKTTKMLVRSKLKDQNISKTCKIKKNFRQLSLAFSVRGDFLSKPRT